MKPLSLMLQIGDAYVMLDSIIALLRYQAEDGEDWKVLASGAQMKCTIFLSSGHHIKTEATCEEVLKLMDEELTKHAGLPKPN